MSEILIVLALLAVLVLQGWMLALILKLQMDVQKFGRLLLKFRIMLKSGRWVVADGPDKVES